MKKIILSILAFVLLISCNTATNPAFTIVDKTHSTTIYISKDANELIRWAAHDFAKDIESISGKTIEVKPVNTFNTENKGIYIAKSGSKFSKSLPVDLKKIQGNWEKFVIEKHDGSLFITGSDVRGTVYGIFDVAKRLGISPWKWWADVTPEKKDVVELHLPENGIESEPSVKYRGIFLNDEDWGLQPWAAKTYEPETGDIGPKTYEKIFQLLLRLKANTIWPAMHPSTKPFFTIPGNKEMAEKYHICIGTSHAEPMLRNNVREWNKQKYGEFNYFINRDRVKEYWKERVAETKDDNDIYTLGMRGIHDSGMEGNATLQQKVQLLDTVISDQREILTEVLQKPIDEIPQVFVPYKEVLEQYDNGLKLPDDVTLMWTDDNYGYIRRLSNKKEQQRSGGSGVYYHLSYWGRPHDYLWLSTTQPGLIWYEMSRAYQNGAKTIWIANVGDIKPAEYNIEFFLDLAWDINSIDENSIIDHMENWASREFGTDNAAQITKMMNEYYRLAFLRKPEYMGWSQTEPTTPTRMSEFTTGNNNELQRRMDAYSQLYNSAASVESSIPKDRQAAYFQLVEYPVKCAALMNFKFLYYQQSLLATNKSQKEMLAAKAEEAYEEIKTLTTKYNELNGGKWKNIMSMHPRDLPAYSMPTYTLPDSVIVNQNADKQKTSPIFIQANEFERAGNVDNYQWKSVEQLGYSNAAVTLFPLNNHTFTNEKPYLQYNFDIKKPGKYTIEIRCLPTHSNHFNDELTVEVNGTGQKKFVLNTHGRSEAWKTNVLRNFVAVDYPVAFDKRGKQVLRIYVNQTGIVLDQIAVNPKNTPHYYEIPVDDGL